METNRLWKFIHIQVYLLSCILIASRIHILFPNFILSFGMGSLWFAFLCYQGFSFSLIQKYSKKLFYFLLILFILGLILVLKFPISDQDSLNYHVMRIFRWMEYRNYIDHPTPVSPRETLNLLGNSLLSYSFFKSFGGSLLHSPINLFLMNLFVFSAICLERILKISIGLLVVSCVAIPCILTTQSNTLQEMGCAAFFMVQLVILNKDQITSKDLFLFALTTGLIFSTKFLFVMPSFVILIGILFSGKFKNHESLKRSLGLKNIFICFVLFLSTSLIEKYYYNISHFGSINGFYSANSKPLHFGIAGFANLWRYFLGTILDTLVSLKLIFAAFSIKAYDGFVQLISENFIQSVFKIPALGIANLGDPSDDVNFNDLIHFPSPISSYMGILGIISFVTILFNFKKIYSNFPLRISLLAALIYVIAVSFEISWIPAYGRLLIPSFLIIMMIVCSVIKQNKILLGVSLIQIILVLLISYHSPIFNLRFLKDKEIHSPFPIFQSKSFELATFTEPEMYRDFYEFLKEEKKIGKTTIFSPMHYPYQLIWALDLKYEIKFQCEENLQSDILIFTDNLDPCAQKLATHYNHKKEFNIIKKSTLNSNRSFSKVITVFY